MAGLSFAVLQSLVAPALPAIASDLNSTVDDISWTLTAYLPLSIGIVPAGPIVDHLSWQWLFWLPLVLIAAALAGIAFGVPESPVPRSCSSRPCWSCPRRPVTASARR